VLSRYRILAKLGAGGMGVVYRAEDVTLRRQVALKFLSAASVSQPQTRARFLREAQTAAGLNHPNVCTIHEVGEVQKGEEDFLGSGERLEAGTPFIAMELIEGRTLRDAIAGGPLPVRDALRVGVEIADGLAAAHHAHVIHRDLKPDNVIVTPDGRVKILDFGLAKVLEERGAADAEDASGLPTISDEMTQAGRVLGTAAYMSPEQARGLTVDTRSDIFSFGIVLYEMVTGKAPFRGSTSIDTLTAILREQPVPPVQLNPEVPAELTRIIGKCLEKEAGERYQDTRDLVVDLRHLRRDSDGQGTVRAEDSAPSVSPVRKVDFRRRTVAVVGLAAILLAAVASARYLLTREPGSHEVAQPPLSMKMRRLARIADTADAALSPDGRFLAYVARKGGQCGLWIRQVSTGSDIQIVPPQEPTPTGVRFSPNGEYLYFLTQDPEAIIYRALFQVPTLGGTPRKVLFDVDSGVTFSPDGRRMAFMRGLTEPKANFSNALMVADADGAQPRQLVVKNYPEWFNLSVAPSWSPDGRRIAAAVFRSSGAGHFEIAEFDAADGKEFRIGMKRWRAIHALAWLPDGSGFALIGGDEGEPAPQIWLLSYPGGMARRITHDLNAYVGLSVSADAKTLATVQVTSVADLWDAPAGDPAAARQITSGEGSARLPGVAYIDFVRGGLASTPSGRILFESARGGSKAIWSIARDGTNRGRLTPEGIEADAPLVAREAGTIVFAASGADRIEHVWRMDADGSNATSLTHGDGECPVAISPDGRWLVYASSNDASLWRMTLAQGAATRIDVPELGTVTPRYSPDGRFLWIGTVKRKEGRSAFALEQFTAEGGPTQRWIEWPRRCEFTLPWRWAPSGDALTCVGELDGVYNLWKQPLAGGEAEPVTRFESGHVLDFDWSTDGGQLFMLRGDFTTDVILITDYR
jgi:Tol biopolymer transport system component/predicted Ser/Thr protein kinase